jgi:hypothetical protein
MPTNDPNDFLPAPDPEPTTQTDLLEQLLVVAAEKAARQEADSALRKGYVTREQINAALAAFGDGLEDRIVNRIVTEMQPRTEGIVQKALQSDPGRKSVVQTEADERDADPVAYLLKKGRTLGPEAYDDTDKQIIWALTYAGLSKGMDNGEVAGE